MNLRWPILIFLSLSILGSVPSAKGISLSCSSCYVGNCECTTDCPSGYIDIFEGSNCEGTSELGFSFSENSIIWEPDEEKTYKAKIRCDNAEFSSCLSILVSGSPAASTTSTTRRPHHHPRPPRTTTTTSTTTTSTTITTTSTTTTSSSTTTTTLRESSTSLPLCNKNGYCEVGRGENYENCQQDCPSGYEDGYCDGVPDGRCDPDCLSWEDTDCRESQCGDGTCEVSLGENYENCPEDCEAPVVCRDGICNWLEGENYIVCPEDCQSGKKDGYCDEIKDERCDPDCDKGEDPDCGGGFTSELMNFLPYLLGLLLLIFLVFILRRRKSGKKEDSGRVMGWVRKKLKEGEDPEVLRKGLGEEGFDPGLVDKAEENLWS